MRLVIRTWPFSPGRQNPQIASILACADPSPHLFRPRLHRRPRPRRISGLMDQPNKGYRTALTIRYCRSPESRELDNAGRKVQLPQKSPTASTTSCCRRSAWRRCTAAAPCLTPALHQPGAIALTARPCGSRFEAIDCSGRISRLDLALNHGQPRDEISPAQESRRVSSSCRSPPRMQLDACDLVAATLRTGWFGRPVLGDALDPLEGLPHCSQRYAYVGIALASHTSADQP